MARNGHPAVPGPMSAFEPTPDVTEGRIERQILTHFGHHCSYDERTYTLADPMSLALAHMRKIGLAAVALTSIVNAPAQTIEPTLFTAFKAYCIDTSAVPETVEKTVETAGGVVKNSASPVSRGTAWDLNFRGENFEVGSLGLHPADANEPDQDICSLMGSSNDDVALVEAIRNWTGVASVAANPNANVGGLVWIEFNYQDVAGVSKALPSDRVVLDMTKAEGHVWRVMLMWSPRLTVIELRHYLPAVRR